MCLSGFFFRKMSFSQLKVSMQKKSFIMAGNFRNFQSQKCFLEMIPSFLLGQRLRHQQPIDLKKKKKSSQSSNEWSYIKGLILYFNIYEMAILDKHVQTITLSNYENIYSSRILFIVEVIMKQMNKTLDEISDDKIM